MIDGFAQVKIAKVEQLPELTRLARADHHSVYAPTHVIWKDEAISGYFSMAGRPLVLAWLSTHTMQARESFYLINLVENQLALNGARGSVFPVQKTSPFHPVMEHMGFQNAGSYDLFVKEY